MNSDPANLNAYLAKTGVLNDLAGDSQYSFDSQVPADGTYQTLGNSLDGPPPTFSDLVYRGEAVNFSLLNITEGAGILKRYQNMCDDEGDEEEDDSDVSDLIKEQQVGLSPIGKGEYSTDIKQGLNDCWFVATAIALSKYGRNPAGLIDVKDGNYMVSFPKEAGISVSDPAKDMKNYGTTGKDGQWLAILEKAAGVFLAKNGKNKLPGSKETYGDRFGERKSDAPFDWINCPAIPDMGILLLTGNGVDATTLSLADTGGLGKTIQGAIDKKKVILAQSSRQHNEKTDGIKAGHIYAVIGIKDGMVILFNPQGKDAPDYFVNENGVQKKKNRNSDGPVFSMSIAEFKNSFQNVLIEH